MSIRIKVAVADLIAKIEKRKADAEKVAAQKNADYQKRLMQWQKDMHKWVDDVVAEKPVHQPSRPYPTTASVKSYDRDIALLKMSVDAYLTIGVNSDFFKYLHD